MITYTSIHPTKDNCLDGDTENVSIEQTESNWMQGSDEIVESEEWQLVCRLASICLQYPDESWVLADEVSNLLEYLKTDAIKRYFEQFFNYLKVTNVEQLTENYVHTFDFNDKTNLYLTYVGLKEERERGQVLIQLKELYASLGYEMVTEDLSDYLPLFLEFLSIAPLEVVKHAVQPYRLAFEKLSTELQAIDSPYAVVLQACMITIDGLVK